MFVNANSLYFIVVLINFTTGTWKKVTVVYIEHINSIPIDTQNVLCKLDKLLFPL